MGVWDMENILYFILLPIQQMSDISLQHCKGMLKTAVLPGRVSRPLLQHPIKYVVCPRSDFSSAMYKSTGLHFLLVLFNMLYSGRLSLISSICHFFLFAEVRFLLSADAFKRLLVLNLLQKSSTQLSFQLEVSKIRPS
mgnify:CR=1 FL=1